jgi:hypothetical protein
MLRLLRAVVGRADTALAVRAELGAIDATLRAVGVVERAELVAGLKSNSYGVKE